MSKLFFFLLLLPFFLSATPWGKDSDLVISNKKIYRKNECRTPFFGQFAESMIRFHQEVISPADGPRSHFYPSSSQYTLDAMRKYGFYRGFLMGCDRLMRENEEAWVYPTISSPGGLKLKYDPVP
jgi:putative component of membrane protein insertase Oxa1/YidC/SpoIIIJ protein YidD